MSFRPFHAPEWKYALIVLAVYVVFVCLRLAMHNWDPSFFICANYEFCDPAQMPVPIHINNDRAAYDGQYYYRIGMKPWHTQPQAFGIRLDLPAYRHQRVGYPLISWLFSLGQPQLLAAAMILVNLFWLTILAIITVRWCRDLNVPPIWGMLPLLWPGLLLTLARDLTEIQESALLVIGFWLVFKNRLGWASMDLAGAILTRESAALPIGVIALFFLWQTMSRNQWSQGWRLLWFTIPFTVMVAWHGYLRLQYGVWPILSIPPNILAISWIPFHGLIQFLLNGSSFNPVKIANDFFGLSPSIIETIYQIYCFGFIVLLVAETLLSVLALHHSCIPAVFKLAWLSLLVLNYAQTQANWSFGPSAFLRHGINLIIFGALILSMNSNRLRSISLVLLFGGWLVALPYCIFMP